MSTPLTIDELKALQVGDWVYIMTLTLDTSPEFDLFDKEFYYRVASREDDTFFEVIGGELVVRHYLRWEDLGTKWIAYKNKEQAETKGELVELLCKVGDTFYGFPNIIDTPNQYFKYTCKGIEWRNDGIYLITTYDMRFQYGVAAFMTEAEARLQELRGEK